MISFNLMCSNEHELEGWFRNSAEFEKQAKKKRVECPYCGDPAVAKAPLAPAIGAQSAVRERRPQKTAPGTKMRKALVEMREFVGKNIHDGGTRFPREARPE